MQEPYKIAKILSVFFSLICFWTVSFPELSLATPSINSQLEQQVLQIIREHPEVILNSVQRYQQQQRQQKIRQQRQAFFDAIKTNPESIIANSPALGNSDTALLLVEFSDFQCPYCAKAHQTIQAFMTKHGDEITLVYKHLPLTAIHPQAMAASQAAYAAYQQGKFWQYHDALFEQQKQLGEELYLRIAKSLNLNLTQFNQDRKQGLTQIQNDMKLAQQLRISGTPFFIMGDRTFSGALPLSEIEAIFAEVKGN